ARVSRFWLCWMRKTMRKVMMVVPVLMTSCQVSLKWKIGPVIAQTRTIPRARQNAAGRPETRAAHRAKPSNARSTEPAFAGGAFSFPMEPPLEKVPWEPEGSGKGSSRQGEVRERSTVEAHRLLGRHSAFRPGAPGPVRGPARRRLWRHRGDRANRRQEPT